MCWANRGGLASVDGAEREWARRSGAPVALHAKFSNYRWAGGGHELLRTAIGARPPTCCHPGCMGTCAPSRRHRWPPVRLRHFSRQTDIRGWRRAGPERTSAREHYAASGARGSPGARARQGAAHKAQQVAPCPQAVRSGRGPQPSGWLAAFLAAGRPWSFAAAMRRCGDRLWGAWLGRRQTCTPLAATHGRRRCLLPERRQRLGGLERCSRMPVSAPGHLPDPCVSWTALPLAFCRRAAGPGLLRGDRAAGGARCRAEAGAAAPRGSAEEAELQNLMVRLREDDVEYFDLKARRLLAAAGC